MPLLEVIQLGKQIDGVSLVGDISFVLDKGKKMAIAGATGSGKTTLLKMLAGLVEPSSGTILLNGKRVDGPAERLLPGHPGIAYVSQHFELRNHYRMLELLEMASHVDQEQATRIYELCRIRHLLHRKNNQLSGGERQRVALALAVLKAPQLLLLDEPFSNMDAGHTQILKEVLNNLIQTLSTTMLLVSHDARDSLTWADEILVLQHGQIMQAGSPRHVYFKPVNEGIAGLFGAYNLVPTSAMDALQFLRMKEDSARQLFLRPEQLYLQAHGQANGVVLRTAFAGPYQEVHVSIAGSTLLAYTRADEQWQPGQPVAVQIRESSHWFL